MDDTKAIESLTREMELARNEMAALTDALRAQTFQAQELTAVTAHLAELIEARSKQGGFWQRLAD